MSIEVASVKWGADRLLIVKRDSEGNLWTDAIEGRGLRRAMNQTDTIRFLADLSRLIEQYIHV